MLKIKNSMATIQTQPQTQLQHNKNNNNSNHQRQTTRPSFANAKLSTIQEEQPRDLVVLDDLLLHQQSPQHSAKSTTPSGTVVTTKWEIFDSSPSVAPVEHPVPPRFNWEFFDWEPHNTFCEDVWFEFRFSWFAPLSYQWAFHSLLYLDENLDTQPQPQPPFSGNKWGYYNSDHHSSVSYFCGFFPLFHFIKTHL